MERPIDNPNDYEYVFDAWSLCLSCCFFVKFQCTCNNPDMVEKCVVDNVAYRKKEDSVKTQ